MGYKPIAGKLPDLPLTKCRSRTSAGDLRLFVEPRPRERAAPCAAATDEKHPSVLEQRCLTPGNEEGSCCPYRQPLMRSLGVIEVDTMRPRSTEWNEIAAEKCGISAVEHLVYTGRHKILLKVRLYYGGYVADFSENPDRCRQC